MKLNHFQYVIIVFIMYAITLLGGDQKPNSSLQSKSIVPSTNLNASQIGTCNSDITSSVSDWNGQTGGFILPSIGLLTH